MRALLFTFGSFLLTSAVVGHAYYQRKQFYPSVVFITKSNPSMAVIYTQGFVLVLLLGKLMRKLFFGQLRAAEFEHLIERSWYAVTETCLAFTVFRDDFSPKFVALFTLLLFLKSFHWLAEDRVDYMERSPVVTWVFHLRILSLLILLGSLDYLFVDNAYHSTVTKGPSVQLVFGFEYAILLTITTNITIKYILHTIDIESENPWEGKAVYLLHTELVIGFIKVILYAAFMFIMVKIHTFPLFAIRPMYLTTRAFKRALQDVIMSRRAIRNMNHLYPDVTAEELSNSDSTCIICREEMTSGAKRLPCNHIFHTLCLRSWFQRQQTCPTCRLDVLQQAQPQPGNQNQAQNAARPGQPPRAAPPPPGPPQPEQHRHIPRQPHMGYPPFPFAFPMRPPGRHEHAGEAQGGPPGASAAGPSASMPGPSQFPWPRFDVPGGGNNAPGANNNASGSGHRPPSMPFMFPPPFGFPPFPGPFPPPPPTPSAWPLGMPPPMPPPNFEGLSRVELEAMKNADEEGLKNRILCLRNISCLLDAAVLLMCQYSTATGSPTLRNINFQNLPDFESLLKNMKDQEKKDSNESSEPQGATGFTPPRSDLPPESFGDDEDVEGRDEMRKLRLKKFGAESGESKSS